MDIRKSKVEAHHLIPEVGGKSIGPGQLVDLDEVIAPGVTVRDAFPAEFFESPAPAETAAPQPRRAKQQAAEKAEE